MGSSAASVVAFPTEDDIGGPRVTARRVCADPVHVVVRELTPADGRTAFVSLVLMRRWWPRTQSCRRRVELPEHGRDDAVARVVE